MIDAGPSLAFLQFAGVILGVFFFNNLITCTIYVTSGSEIPVSKRGDEMS